MTKVELQADLDKAKRHLKFAEEQAIPFAIEKAKKKISELEEKLAEAEAKSDMKEDVVEKKKEAIVKKAKKVKKEVAVKQVVGKGARGRKKHTKEQRTEKRVTKLAKRTGKTVTIDGKTYTEKDKEFCDMLQKHWDIKRASAKKSNRKFKTKSITQKIGQDIAGTVVKAIKHVVHEDKDKIAKNPKSYVAKIERIEIYANKLASSFRDLLGEDYKSAQMKKEMEDVQKAIKAFVEKFKKHVKK